jgi:glycine/D-amino acid oxidase-like deaminating enzyme/nitrite reductase/ring-hydroxylating ferredoxin subunit
MDSKQNSGSGQTTSGSNQTFWIDSSPSKSYDALNQDIETQVAVIGAGIAGLTVAYCLAKSGKQVIVIEDGLIGSGETGRTTAHIANALDDRYTEIESLFGEEGARLAAESHTAAIALIESISKDENIDCDFKRLDGYLFLHPSDEEKSLEEEYEATRKAGIATELIHGVPGIDLEKGLCLKFPQQGQFHPMKYLNGLAEAFIHKGGKIYTNAHAEEVKEGMIKANGHEIKAESIVVATNSPINDWATMHTKQFPYRSYVIGIKIEKDKVSPALWWDTGDQDSEWITMPYHYVRTNTLDEQFDLLICGGADHKTGQADKENISEEDRYTQLETWLRKRFPQAGETVYRWSGQVMEPLDALGYVGRNPGNKNLYIVTGDSGNGITNGTLAGILITDLINGKENAWEKIYDPSRIKLKTAKDFAVEMGNTAGQYLDLLTQKDVDSLSEIPKGEGAIVGPPVKKLAVYRDEAGALHAYSAVCPHMACVVQWNNDEKSFDCPCHGSRFTCQGKVINGPAYSDLAPAELPKEK